ncbi:MAG: cytochrome c3 family protein [Desulfuromonadaceae bacterium]
MKMLKQVGLMAVLLLLVSGCGTNEQGQSEKAETQSSSMKDGVKHVEAQKVKEQQETAQQDEAAEVSADEADSDTSSSEEENTATADKQKQGAEVESSDEPTPERTSIHTIVMQNKYGKVAFNHAAHTQFISCSTCHSTEPPSRIELNRKEFHAICRTCHHEMDAGPVKCSGCHEH